VPPRAEMRLRLPVCAGCGRAVIAAAHMHVRWGDRDFHLTCAHDELLSLRSAA